MFTFHTILLAICVHLKVYHQDSYENQLSDVGEKSLFFGKLIFRCGKNKQSIILYCRRCCLMFILFFILFYFIYFLLLTCMHMRTVCTGSYTPAICLLNNIIMTFKNKIWSFRLSYLWRGEWCCLLGSTMEDKSGCRLGWICNHQISLQWIIHFRLIWWRTLQTSTLHTGKVGENLGVLGEWFIWKPHPIIDFNICRTLNLGN